MRLTDDRLTALAQRHAGYVNLNILVKEWKDRVIFVRKVAPGAADRSYGIQVARLAGLPEEVLERARTILAELEEHGPQRLLAGGNGDDGTPQIGLFAEGGSGDGAPAGGETGATGAAGPPAARATVESAIAEALRRDLARVDPERMTGVEALVLLQALRRRLGLEGGGAPDAEEEGEAKR